MSHRTDQHLYDDSSDPHQHFLYDRSSDDSQHVVYDDDHSPNHLHHDPCARAFAWCRLAV